MCRNPKTYQFSRTRQDKTIMVISPEHMVGRSFLSNPTDNRTIDNRERPHAFIVKSIEDHDSK